MRTPNGHDGKAPNRLAGEKSPYLLQHAENPVDWYPWGEEAFQKAREEGRPVFLSIGYATCHWCHVMAHESFEDAEVSKALNRSFVSIKVDREERPDVDRVYMTACQAMTKGGGWPLSIFMTPEGKPFFAGTYFPKESRMGMTGFVDLIKRIAELWDQDRNRFVEAGDQITQLLQPRQEAAAEGHTPDEAALAKGCDQLASSFDTTWGGFGKAPKFPMPHNLTFLLRWYARKGTEASKTMVDKTLGAMRKGGMFDQIGFGFHRYSVDEQWLVPHFEKMLYDQALLALAYTEAFQAFGEERHGEVAQEIFTYVLRDMTSPEGGFYSGEDADSEGEEGLFYVWTPEEVKDILGEEVGELFCRFYDIRAGGNFENGKSIPHVVGEPSALAQEAGIKDSSLRELLEEARERLFHVREKRIHPLKDDKVLTSWNGLMIAALAKGYQAFGDPAYKDAASQAIDFILKKLVKDKRFLLRRYREGESAYPGYLDDYAFLVWGLIESYEATFEVRFLEEAVAFQESMIDLFWDEVQGGFFFSGKENEALIVKSKDAYDGALPSGNSVAASNLVRLGRMIGKPEWEERADQVFQAFAPSIVAYPAGFTQFLAALDFMIGPSREIVIAGDPSSDGTQAMLRTVQRMFLPKKVLALRSEGEEGRRLASLAPYTEGLGPVSDQPAAYICEGYACKRPVTDPSVLEAELTSKQAT
jgi:uncharacterized protein YyaL (SSP411 family)